MYYETSAKTGQNINKIFFELSMKIYEYIETNTIDFTNDVLKVIILFFNRISELKKGIYKNKKLWK